MIREAQPDAVIVATIAHMRNASMPISTAGCHRLSANVWTNYFGPQRTIAISFPMRSLQHLF